MHEERISTERIIIINFKRFNLIELKTLSMLFSSKLKFLFVFFIILSLITCESDKGDIIPDTPVNFSIYITDPQFYGIGIPGNSILVKNTDIGTQYLGYNNNGIIIYNAGNEFYAFDATCTFNVASGTAVELNNSSFATCPVCQSNFVFASYGAPTMESVAEFPLKEYNTWYFPSTGEIYVYNK